jgi:adenylate cyclase
VERKLAAILAADVVGYSLLMAADEAGTLGRLKALRRDFIEREISEHRGRIVKLMGDGVLVEFASAVEAVQCALDVQEGMVERNRDLPTDRQIWFRIGINVGDIILDEDDIYGDGVNMAARLEGLAEPGGLCISNLTHSQVVGRLDATFEAGGLQKVKNIADPISVWKWSPGAIELPPHPDLDLPEKPSLVVLPFLNLTRGSDQEIIADGFTEDLITTVSRIGSLFVIARNSAFTYKDRPIAVKQVARELGVRYVIEGSIRQLPGKFRINAQLIDAPTDHHIWAEVYDSALGTFYDEQDQIIRSIVAAIQTQILVREGEIPPGPERGERNTREDLKRAWNRVYQLTPKALAEAEDLAVRVLTAFPDNDRAHQLLAVARFHLIYLGYADDWLASVDRAYQAAERAVELYEASEHSHWILGMALMLRRDHDGAVAELHRAIEINPNFSLGYGSLGTVLAWGGRADEAIRNNETALRLNPRDPSNFFRFFVNALAYFTVGRYEDAAAWATRSLRSKRIFRIPYLVRIAALALDSEIDRARAAVDDMQAHVPDVTRAFVDHLPFVRAEDRAALVRGLELVGVLTPAAP